MSARYKTAKPAPKPAATKPVAERVTPEMKAIGARFAELRDKAGITNKELGELLGVGVNGARKIIDGTSCAKFCDLARWARALNTTPNFLAGFDEAGDPSLVQAAMEASFVGLGLPQEISARLARIVLEAAKAPQPQSAAVDPLTAARLHSEFEVRRLLAAGGEKFQLKT
jgi:transcriptional regulator with XRE-family HTH domain